MDDYRAAPMSGSDVVGTMGSNSKPPSRMSGLAKLLDRKTTDTRLMFEGGCDMYLHMPILRAKSGYFASLSEFVKRQNADGSETLFYQVAAADITDQPEVLRRIILYLYTHRPSDLAITVKTVFCYAKLSDFLDLSDPRDIMTSVVDCLLHQTEPCCYPMLFRAFQRAELPVDNMLHIFKKIIDKQEAGGDEICRVTMSLPVLWLMAEEHGMEVDVHQLRKGARSAIGKVGRFRLIEASEWPSEWFECDLPCFNEAFEDVYGRLRAT
ncbi:uncharacterized protein EV422DRAFT_563678 [Fimicolochytrium jonesii]|uniref:uncharacterized protein n=1 Tax=Fimicolochytrium jonesii TaxID=1396493 RepID=UPI0022FE9076|nr:uncharacterized protein EV422DRAFT_563678 [Fimicolochytrium jonesii]KAI8825849.1 hypothetical protein EV422DRAFT_563678 [Fimicolochytrium jonesii]